MLKKVTLVLLLLLLCACRPSVVENSNGDNFNILSVDQSVSLSLLCFKEDEHNIEITSVMNTLSEAFDKDDKDIIIAPVNIGVKKCLENDNYKLLAILAHSHYYICSTDEAFNKGDVGVYGEKTVLGGVLNALSANFSKYNFIYYDSVQALKDDLNNGVINSAVLSEIDYNDFNNYQDLKFYKIEEIDNVYQKEYSYSDFPTYGLFIKDDVLKNRQNDLSNFIRIVRTSINSYKNDKTTFNKVLETADLERLGFNNPSLISESYNYCGICFEYAIDEYESLKTLLSCMDIELSEKVIVQ